MVFWDLKIQILKKKLLKESNTFSILHWRYVHIILKYLTKQKDNRRLQEQNCTDHVVFFNNLNYLYTYKMY